MRRYIINSLSSFIHLLIAPGILAFNPALTLDNQLAHLTYVNLAPLRKTPTPGRIVAPFDLNQYPPSEPSEPTIASMSSTSPTASSEHILSLLREHPEENQVLSTAESIPDELSSASSLKRKEATKPNVQQMRNIRQRVSEQHGHVAHNNGVGFPGHFTALHSELQVTTKKQAGLLEYTRRSRGKNVRGLSPVHQAEQPLLVNNWDYVKSDLTREGIPDIPAGYGAPEKTEQDFFNFMQKTQSYLLHGETFWIPMERIQQFLEDYRPVGNDFPYPKETSYSIRMSGIRDIMLKIAEDRLQIESCWNSMGGIKTQLKESIDTKGPMSHFIPKIIKLSVTMSVLYLTLSREYEVPTFSRSHISSMLAFIQDATIAFSEKKLPAGLPRSELEKKRRKILCGLASSIKCNAGAEMKLAWDIVYHWLTMTHKTSQTSLTLAKMDLRQVINKIIFFSNYKYFMLKALEHERKQ